jgi:hypothetical protein
MSWLKRRSAGVCLRRAASAFTACQKAASSKCAPSTSLTHSLSNWSAEYNAARSSR